MEINSPFCSHFSSRLSSPNRTKFARPMQIESEVCYQNSESRMRCSESCRFRANFLAAILDLLDSVEWERANEFDVSNFATNSNDFNHFNSPPSPQCNIATDEPQRSSSKSNRSKQRRERERARVLPPMRLLLSHSIREIETVQGARCLLRASVRDDRRSKANKWDGGERAEEGEERRGENELSLQIEFIERIRQPRAVSQASELLSEFVTFGCRTGPSASELFRSSHSKASFGAKSEYKAERYRKSSTENVENRGENIVRWKFSIILNRFR